MRRAGLVLWTLGALAAAPAFGAGLAAAASLNPSPKSLTTYSAASSVPLSTCTLTAAADAYTDKNVLNAGSNFGTAGTLSVRSDVLGDRRTFVRFDLSSCANVAVARVTSAAVQLYLSTAPSASRIYDLQRVTASWTETGITWNTQPVTAVSPTDSVATGTTSAVTLAWSVTSDAQSFIDGGAQNFGWAVRDRTEGSLTARTGTFSSREAPTAAQRPTLVIAYYP